MTHVSRKKLSRETETILSDILRHVLTGCSPSKLDKIMGILITETETKMLLKRIGIIYLLSKNYSIDEIAQATSVTHQTVARIQLELGSKPAEDVKYITRKINTYRNIKNLTSILEDLIESLPYPSKIYKELKKGY